MDDKKEFNPKGGWGLTPDDLAVMARQASEDRRREEARKAGEPPREVKGEMFVMVSGNDNNGIEEGLTTLEEALEKLRPQLDSPDLETRLRALVHTTAIKVVDGIRKEYGADINALAAHTTTPTNRRRIGQAGVAYRGIIDAVSDLLASLMGSLPDPAVQHMLAEYFYIRFASVRNTTLELQHTGKTGHDRVDEAIERVRRAMRDAEDKDK